MLEIRDDDELKLSFKCASEIDCIVKRIIRTNKDINLQIHLLTNCIRCNGQEEPELTFIK